MLTRVVRVLQGAFHLLSNRKGPVQDGAPSVTIQAWRGSRTSAALFARSDDVAHGNAALTRRAAPTRIAPLGPGRTHRRAGAARRPGASRPVRATYSA